MIPLFCCREMAIKFNDYFEFPREFDMAPYTAATLAKVEGKEEGCGAEWERLGGGGGGG